MKSHSNSHKNYIPCFPAFPISDNTPSTFPQQQKLLTLLTELQLTTQSFFQNPNEDSTQKLLDILQKIINLLEPLSYITPIKFSINTLQKLIINLKEPLSPLQEISQLFQLFFQSLISISYVYKFSPDILENLYQLILQNSINSIVSTGATGPTGATG
ncbi:hypothetical protein ABE43_00210, partial [Bacillus thuringiensis]|nr:hypothetical protein [Bacillus thuringiensis]